MVFLNWLTLIDLKKSGLIKPIAMSVDNLTMHNKALLARQLLFKDVKLEAIEAYIERGEYRHLAKNDVLLAPNKKNTNLFLLLSGQLCVHLDNLETPPIVDLGPGECVGEISIFDKGKTSAYVVASEPSELLAIDEDTLWSLVNVSHAVARNLLFILSQRMRYNNVMISDSKKVQRKFEYYAMIDELTGLYNRRWLNKMFDREVKRCIKAKSPLCLVMLDIDHFKEYNDQYGHLAGDHVLCFIAKILRDQLRPNDMITRYGGEEFAVLFPRIHLETTFNIAERVRKAIEVTSAEFLEPSPITVSLGIAQMMEGDTLQSLLEKTDAALYRAKDKGRNCISF